MMSLIKTYRQDLQKEFSGYNGKRFIQDLMAGLTVTAVALPLALAFGVSSGATAASGLITAILAGLITGALSGASYQISGPTGAMTAILLTLSARYGIEGVFTAGLLSGILLLLAAVLKVGRLVSYIPAPVITGFTSGIAVIIALGQVDNFFGTVSQGDTALQKLLSYFTVGFVPNLWAVGIGLLVIIVMIAWPKSLNARFPSSLVGILLALALNLVGNFPVATVGEIPKTLFPENRLTLTGIPYRELGQFIGPAVSIALLGMIESLLCGASAGRMKNEKLNADRELVAQGIGNIIIPFFGGVPATAAIARTSVAIKSGGQTRMVSIIHSVGLLASMFLLGPAMSKIPLSALAGVLIVTAWRMNEWESIRYFFTKKFKTAIAQFLITMVSTVLFDLTTAILIGVAFSMLLFVINSATLQVGEMDTETAKVIEVHGPLFFATQHRLIERMDALEPQSVLILSLSGVSIMDSSAVTALEQAIRHLKAQGTDVLFCAMQPAVKRMFERSDLPELAAEFDIFSDYDPLADISVPK